MHMKRFLLLLLISGSMIYCNVANAKSDNNYDVKIQNITSTNGEYCRYITGIAVNQSTTTYSIFGLTFDLYDSAGNIVGNTSDSIQNFRPGQSWRFKAMIMEESTAKYQLSGMSGY